MPSLRVAATQEVRMPTMAVCKRALRRFAETWRGGSRIGWRGTDLRQPAASSWCQRRRTPPAQHHGHCADRSFRNYGPGNVTHDRRPQTVAVMERLMTLGMSRSRLDSIDRGVRALIQDHRICLFIPPYPFPRSNDWLPFLAALCSASSPYEASRDHDWHQTRE